MLDQLGAESAADDIDDLYGGLLGVWDVVNRYRVGDVEKHGTVVWTFGRILAGRGVQDVMWFTAPGDDGYPVRMTGSTVRLFDQAGGAWRIVWFSPAGTTGTLTGRPGEHGDIVQEGTNSAGKPARWLFTEVTGTTFRWLGYVSDDDGTTWRLEQEMLARRRPVPVTPGKTCPFPAAT